MYADRSWGANRSAPLYRLLGQGIQAETEQLVVDEGKNASVDGCFGVSGHQACR